MSTLQTPTRRPPPAPKGEGATPTANSRGKPGARRPPPPPNRSTAASKETLSTSVFIANSQARSSSLVQPMEKEYYWIPHPSKYVFPAR